MSRIIRNPIETPDWDEGFQKKRPKKSKKIAPDREKTKRSQKRTNGQKAKALRGIERETGDE